MARLRDHESELGARTDQQLLEGRGGGAHGREKVGMASLAGIFDSGCRE
jgi:hypothetical protein